MITIHDVPQLSNEWFALRCGSLGGSRVKDAMAGGQGKSRKTLAYQLASELVTGAKTEIRTTPAMQWGIDTEPEAREYFEFVEGVTVQQLGLVTNDLYPGCHVSPDGSLNESTGLEIKCPQPATHAKYLNENRLPPEYKAQPQFSMMICEASHWWFLSYNPLFSRQLLIKVDRDNSYISEIQSKLNVFFEELEIIKTNVL